MATWIAHFHIAQAILEMGFDFNRAMFLVGNIAPDSGTIDKENLIYTPDKTTSHWRNADNVIETERFYATHLTKPIPDTSRYAFLIGYYCHLIADREWSETVWKSKQATALYSVPIKKDKQFIWEIKKDWYGIDFLYLQENQNSVFYTDFIQIEAVPDYLPAFPKGAFTTESEIQKPIISMVQNGTWTAPIFT